MPKNETKQNIEIGGNVEKSINTSGDGNNANQNIVNVNVNTERSDKDGNVSEKTNKNSYLKAILIFVCLFFAAPVPYLWNKYGKPEKIHPKFAIENRILRSDAALIIKAGNESANRRQPLTVEFDGLPFDEKGIPVDNQGDDKRQCWHFSLKAQNPPPEYLRDGAHQIRAGFAGEDPVDVQKIIFHTKAPVTGVQISEAPGTPDAKEIKIKAASELQLPENALSVEMVFYHEGEPQTVNLPIKQVHDPKTGILCYEFQTKIQGLQKISDKDPRYAEPFFGLKVSDQAGNSYYQEQSYAQYMAPGSNRFGVNDMASITVEKIPDADKKEFIHFVRLIPQIKRVNQLSNGKPPIELKVTARSDNSRYLEWKSNVKDDVKALTLVFRDEKQIGVSTTSFYSDNELLNKDSADYRVEQEGKDGTRYLSNKETFKKPVEKKGSMFVKTDPPDALVRISDFSKPYSPGIELDAGKYTVEASKEGYEPAKESVSIAAGEKKEINVRLRAVPPPVIKLRSKPITVSDEDALKTFKLKKDSDGFRRPLEYVKNDFKDNGDGTITDRTTGLIWQKSGSDKYMPYKDATSYIDGLNSGKFAGYSDWRLPTVDELRSLLTPEKQSNGLYISPIFDKNQLWCWTSDQRASGGAWSVYFGNGVVSWHYLDFDDYARAVRLRQ
jgi:hypothetical protein